ncbi:MAG TPA: retropepsin-like aspartic protease [Acetobacteraceae bacterium]|jgi:predicted aspartyl protease|nr:retropepsin-like aspartic protease [Acetobacteraceae bacterium]
MIRALLALALLSGVAGCATDDPYRPNAQGVCPLIREATTPIETHRNMLFVLVTIDGQKVKLLVDTGAEKTLLTEDAVARLRLPRDYTHATRTYGIGDATAAWDALLPHGMVIGGVEFPVDRVTVGRFGISNVGGDAADGLLGADILLAFDLDLDLPQGQLSLYRARRQCPDAAPPWPQPYIDVAGVATRQDRLMVPFELDGVSGLAVMDTGAQLSSISEHLAERMGVAADALSADRTVMAHGAAPNQVAVRLHRFRELRIGPAVMEAPSLPVVPMTGGMGDALVGADFLKGRRAWLSYSTRRIFVTPLEPAPLLAVTDAPE